jgi:hypothetical protein
VVAHPRAAGGLRRVRPFNVAQGRPLNRPRPLRVEVGEHRPIAIYLSGQRLAVEAVLETWRIDDEWWRERPVSRLYFSLLLEDGRVVTVYRNLVSGRWWEQGYATSTQTA